MSHVTHQYDNAYTTAGFGTRLLSALQMRDDFYKGDGYDNVDAAYCLDATPLIVAGSTHNGAAVVGPSTHLRNSRIAKG